MRETRLNTFRRFTLKRGVLVVALAFIAPLTLAADRDDTSGDAKSNDAKSKPLPDFSQLNVVRVIYDSDDSEGRAYYAYDGRVWARWETDYPEGEENFVRRLVKLSRVTANPSVVTRRFDAPDLGDFPLLFMSDAGWMLMSAKEKAGLAQYLARGGFIWADRLWGEAEWRNFADLIRDALKGRQWRAVPSNNPIFHTVFDLQALPQVPATPFARQGGSSAEPADFHKYPAVSTDKAELRGWFDDSGRLMIVADYNSDLADGFEREAFGQWYFETYSTKAYMMGVNIITYAMTH